MSTTEATRSRIRFHDLVDDRVDEGVFRVDRSIYTDEAVFEAEIERIFEGGWVFLCHESQVEKPGDYWSTEIGRQPVFVMRQKDGSLGCFINACSHRGALLTPLKQGTGECAHLPFPRLGVRPRRTLHQHQERGGGLPGTLARRLQPPSDRRPRLL